MIGALTWLLGSKTGRYLAIALLLIAVGWALIRLVLARGAATEQARQRLATLLAVMEKVKTVEDIRRCTPDERRRRLHEWSRG